MGNWPECDYNHILVYIPIIYHDEHIGEHTIYYNLDGEIDDDLFVIY